LMDIRDYPTSLQARLLTRARELRDKRRNSKTRDPMRTGAATCCAAAAAPARQAATVASHEKKYFPSFHLSKRKTLGSPQKTTTPRGWWPVIRNQYGHLMFIRRVS
jgi:hypothetical protein